MAKKKISKKETIEEVKKEVKTSLFDLISFLTDKKKSWDELTVEEQKAFNPYMINKFLSMDLFLVEALNDLQKYTLNCMDKKDVYNLLYHLLPKQKFYLKYIKPQNEISDKELSLLIKHFKVSKREAEDYYNLLQNTSKGRDYIEMLKDNFSYENK